MFSVAFVAVALFSCSPGESIAGDERGVPDISHAETPSDWLQIARNDLQQPRQVLFERITSLGSIQSGRLTFQDAEHFWVASTISVARTTPDGQSEQVQLQVVSAADGVTLRIQQPAVFGAPASTAVFPVQRFDELALVSPQSPLHRYRLESLNPILMAQALLEQCSNPKAFGPKDTEGRRSYSAQLETRQLHDLGLVEAGDLDSTFQLQFELAEDSGEFTGLQVVGMASGIVLLQIRLSRLPAAASMNNEEFSLTIPEGQVVVDLAQQLTR